MRKLPAILICLVALAGFALMMQQDVYARADLDGGVVVTNNGNIAVGVRVKNADGSYGTAQVLQPGQSATLEEGAERVRVDTKVGAVSIHSMTHNGAEVENPNLQVDIEKSDGSTIQVTGTNGKEGRSIVVTSQTAQGAVRSGGPSGATVVIPAVSNDKVGANRSGVTMGSGAPPAASDGPLVNLGTQSVDRPESDDIKQLQEDYDVSDAELKMYRDEGMTDEQIIDWVVGWEDFCDMVSGSGGQFGDGIGVVPIYPYGFPGQPRQVPIGSDIIYDRSRTMVFGDQVLWDAYGTTNFTGLFRGQFRVDPVEDVSHTR